MPSFHSIRVWLLAPRVMVVMLIMLGGASPLRVLAVAGEQDARINVSGYALGATVTQPSNLSSGTSPAVVLVGSSASDNRSETAFGISIFDQLAAGLSHTGYLVVRYDRRGTGQSDGRTESTTLAEYAGDLRAVVRFTSDRKDVDRRRIAVVGYGDGADVAMLAAAKEGRIGAVVLAAASSLSGADLNLYEVTHAMERSTKTPEERQALIDMQKKLQMAVLTGSGWPQLPPELRRQADTPWFESVLSFNPAQAMPGIDKPVLIVQGGLDRQLPPDNAEKLLSLARNRRKSSTDLVIVPGVNHLLVPATTGETDEYASLSDARVSPLVTDAMTAWLKKTFAVVR